MIRLALLVTSCACSPTRPPPIPWVNPARCIRPCTHLDENHLVTVDAIGRVAPGPGPQRFDAAAQPALEAFLAAAAAAGHGVTLGESFRTYATQRMVWERKLTELGLAARPGHSEHELGLAVDLAYAPSAQDWLEAHAWEHGFVLSYPKDAERATGFRWEPWHFRYTGTAVARLLHERPGTSLEELFESDPSLGESGDCSDCTAPESTSTCEGLDAQGRCDGSTLRWCFKGAANAIDCAPIQQTCVATEARIACRP